MNITAYKLFDDADAIFPIERASYKRDWMDNYNHDFAYRCLPLKIANEAGWVVRCPIDFEVNYISDEHYKTSVEIKIDDKDFIYKNRITSHFGRGVVTFSLPFIIRTPPNWCIWARGYPNHFKNNISFLEGIVETYWLDSTFTYNVRIVEKNQPVKFIKGEPLFFMTLININEINNSIITYDSIDNNPLLKKVYKEWSDSRSAFNKSSRKPEDWQKHYFKGLGLNNNKSIISTHLTKINTDIKK